MENTGKVHFEFEDQTPHWYVALGERLIGPMNAADVYTRVVSGEISWAHFVWKPGQVDWKRICDTKTFQSAVPSAPAKGMQNQVKEASRPTVRKVQSSGQGGMKTPPKPGRGTGEISWPGFAQPPAESKDWFLYYNESQFGPFTEGDIHRFLKAGKIHGRVHTWKDGMGGWERIERLPVFEASSLAATAARESKKAGKAAAPTVQAASDKRVAARKPLIAKILMANHDSLTAAVCRDISVGGMQVLTDRIPGAPGTRIKMNVSPSGAAGATNAANGSIAPFVAEGVIVRILEDGHGFSFRFDKLSDAAKRVIEGYIQQNEG